MSKEYKNVPYEVEVTDSNVCATPCRDAIPTSDGVVTHVGSIGCQHCEYYRGINPTDKIVFCSKGGK